MRSVKFQIPCHDGEATAEVTEDGDLVLNGYDDLYEAAMKEMGIPESACQLALHLWNEKAWYMHVLSKHYLRHIDPRLVASFCVDLVRHATNAIVSPETIQVPCGRIREYTSILEEFSQGADLNSERVNKMQEEAHFLAGRAFSAGDLVGAAMFDAFSNLSAWLYGIGIWYEADGDPALDFHDSLFDFSGFLAVAVGEKARYRGYERSDSAYAAEDMAERLWQVRNFVEVFGSES